MSSTVRHFGVISSAAAAVLFCIGGCVVIGLWHIRTMSELPGIKTHKSQTAGASWPSARNLTGSNWSIFRSLGPNASIDKNNIASRYRLAGTYGFTSINGEELRKAIIDIIQTKEELIVSKGESIGSAEVIDIGLEHVVLREFGVVQPLRLGYTNLNIMAISGTTNMAIGSNLELSDKDVVISTNIYGAEVGEGRWVMSRTKVMGYVSEMAENPSRMSKLFDSMQPVYQFSADGKRSITGYQLHVVGEGDFYEAVGLREGDIVRKVNEMPITSYRRSMFWIDQFRQDRVNSFILDIERNGKSARLEYLVR